MQKASYTPLLRRMVDLQSKLTAENIAIYEAAPEMLKQLKESLTDCSDGIDVRIIHLIKKIEGK